jgi:hypothetical protein
LSNHSECSLQRTPQGLQLLGHTLHRKSVRKEEKLSRTFDVSIFYDVQSANGVYLS